MNLDTLWDWDILRTLVPLCIPPTRATKTWTAFSCQLTMSEGYSLFMVGVPLKSHETCSNDSIQYSIPESVLAERRLHARYPFFSLQIHIQSKYSSFMPWPKRNRRISSVQNQMLFYSLTRNIHRLFSISTKFSIKPVICYKQAQTLM